MLLARSSARDLHQAMETVDLLVTPTVPTTAFSADLDGPSQVEGKEVTPIGWFGLTAVSNLTGQPAASVPAGFGSKGLPVGLQIIGRRYADWKVLMLSKTFQELTGWEKIWPDLALSQPTRADEGCN